MSDVEIDVEAFGRRGAQLVKAIGASSSTTSLSSVDTILVQLGARQQDDIFLTKSGALHIWLLGYEFPATLILLTKEKITFVTSPSKAKLLEPLNKQKSVQVEIIKRPKDEEGGKKTFEEFAERVSASTNLGLFTKEKATGKFTDEWESVWSSKKPSSLQETDVSDGVASVWSTKDDSELKCHRLAARLSSHLVSGYFVDEMSRILDEGKKVGCEKLARRVENRLDDEDAWKKAKGIKEADTSLAEWCHLPVVQSGGSYDIKFSGQSSDGKLDGNETAGNVVIASLGVKYKSYCSWVGRTFCIDPHKNTQRQYSNLLALQNELVDNVLKPGKTGAEIYEEAIEFVKKKDSKLAEFLPKNLGFATGLEIRDSSFMLSPKNNKPLKANMVICLALGFSDLPDEEPQRKADGKKYSLLAVDTIRVNEEGAATILSERIKGASDMMFFNNDDESEKEEKRSSPAKTVTAGGKVLRNRSNALATESLDKRIKEHQRELSDAKHQEGLDKWAGEEGEGGKERGKTFKKFESYKKESNMPVSSKAGDVKIILDQRAASVLLPIYGFSVPFHINTIKNVSKSDEGEWTYLRFNFISPGQIAGKKEDVPFEDPEATFIRQMSFRSQDAFHFGELAKMITDMKKEVTKKETEKKEMADVVVQDKLQLIKGRPSVLSDVYPRPALEGKRHPGDLEIHQNGIRFKSPYKEGHVIDLLFSNIRHLFYQSCDGELIAIIHIHLKAPIMVGKKKSKDVQFFREASDVTFDETGNKKRKYRTGDEDEIELEQEEKRRRHQLNKEFKHFANKIADASDGRFSVDIPMRELGFSGVPHRTNVQILPTTDCIVHLTDPPFFVVSLADIEVAHLERVAYGLKNFDLVLVLSDFSKAPLHINSIPMTQLDSVKEFLDSVDICISEGPVNLNWSAIMKTIQDDPYDFFNEGGWGFLRSSGSDAGSSESESGSEFGDEEEAVAEVLSSEDDDGSGDDGSDFGDSEDSDDDGSDAEGDLSESGEDWDELERKAARADDKKGGESEDEDEKKKKKKGGR